MRTATVESTTIEYPDEICLAFNPVIVNVYGQEWKYIEVGVYNWNTNKSISEKRVMFGNRCFFDMSTYMQGFFQGADFSQVNYAQPHYELTKAGIKCTIEVKMYRADGGSYAYFKDETFVIWGAMKVGEQYNRFKKVTWFKNYPFSVGMYVPGKSKIIAVADKNSKTQIDVIKQGEHEVQGVYNIMLNSIEASNEVKFYLNPKISASVWDFTFDYNFRPLFSTPAEVVCDVNDCSEGLYLRWINRHGFYCYWLFKQGNPVSTVSEEGEFVRNNMFDFSFSTPYNGGTGRAQAKTEITKIPICAPLVDSETYDFLFELNTSPVVDMYYGNDPNGNPLFAGVNIQTENYTRIKKHLQDFTATVILPETRIQKL